MHNAPAQATTKAAHDAGLTGRQLVIKLVELGLVEDNILRI